jgi:predicted cupin superfamily sugar epimerase
MQRHPEGGYYVETDRDRLRIPNPFRTHDDDEEDSTRSASTTIHYLLTPGAPFGALHRNRARTVHTLHQGRGRYVVVHADEVEGGGTGKKARVEVFDVGTDVLKGERVQWIVEGGKYKASWLLPDRPDGGVESEGGLLISETVVPGFEFRDHDFLRGERLDELVGEEQAEEMRWLVRKSDG